MGVQLSYCNIPVFCPQRFFPQCMETRKNKTCTQGWYNISDITNYRPISLRSIRSKLLEHILARHLIECFNEYNPLDQRQHGFRSGFSRVTQLIEIVHNLSETIICRGQTDIIFLDFAKAFDKVSHPKLLIKTDLTSRKPSISAKALFISKL